MLPTRTRVRKSIAARFSAAADTYDNHAAVQSRTASQLINLLAAKLSAKSILEIGCGTGILTKKLAKRFPFARICATDISDGMIRHAREHFKPPKNISWLTGDFRESRNLGTFDLVISSSALHWITPLSRTFRKISALISKDGTLAFGIMLKGTLAEVHTARRKVVPSKKARKQLLPENKVLTLLKASGLTILKKHRAIYRNVFKSGRLLLRSLHEQGVTSGPFASGQTPLNRRELEKLVSYYDKHYKCTDGVYATYKVLFVLATRKTL